MRGMANQQERLGAGTNGRRGEGYVEICGARREKEEQQGGARRKEEEGGGRRWRKRKEEVDEAGLLQAMHPLVGEPLR